MERSRWEADCREDTPPKFTLPALESWRGREIVGFIAMLVCEGNGMAVLEALWLRNGRQSHCCQVDWNRRIVLRAGQMIEMQKRAGQVGGVREDKELEWNGYSCQEDECLAECLPDVTSSVCGNSRCPANLENAGLASHAWQLRSVTSSTATHFRSSSFFITSSSSLHPPPFILLPSSWLFLVLPILSLYKR